MDTEGFDEIRGRIERIEHKAELGRARAEADGWRKVAERRLKHIEECESALTKRNECISKLEKQVGYLRAELANAEVLSGRERQIIGMWPKFEDGEPVMIGDEVGGLGGEIVEVYITENEVAIWNSCANHMHLRLGECVKRPAPKVLDADGVEIKVGDTVWHRSGFGHGVVTSIDEDSLMGTVRYVNGCEEFIDVARCLTHTRPDSWERLEEDAVREPCDYFGVECDEDKGCSGCPHFHKGRDCTIDMHIDIVRRAKALAGAEVE